VLKFPAADPFTIDKWMVSLSFFKIENEKWQILLLLLV
jgi:hypothetical protein